MGAPTRNLNSVNIFGSAVSKNEIPAKPQPEAAQMTIFYVGQVIVFNDFPTEKAKEIMLLASKGIEIEKDLKEFMEKTNEGTSVLVHRTRAVCFAGGSSFEASRKLQKQIIF